MRGLRGWEIGEDATGMGWEIEEPGGAGRSRRSYREGLGDRRRESTPLPRGGAGR